MVLKMPVSTIVLRSVKSDLYGASSYHQKKLSMSLKSFLNVEFSQFSCKPTFENNSELNFEKENVCLTLFMIGRGGGGGEGVCGPKRPPS